MMRRLIFAAFAIALVGFAPTAQATLVTYYAVLNGLNESPANGSPGTGYVQVGYDDVAHTLSVNAWFKDLTSPNIAAHIHAATALPFAGTAGVATTTPTFSGFPSGTTSGSYSNVLDLTNASSYRAAFITASGGTVAGAEAALTAAIADGKSYFNIHTTNFSGGEIRGFLAPVPEPGTLILTGLALAGLATRLRRHSTQLPV